MAGCEPAAHRPERCALPAWFRRERPRRLRETVTPHCCYRRLGSRIEIDRKSRVDGASRNEIANLPIREFAKWKHLPHGAGHFEYRNARIIDIIDQVADN